MVRVNVRVRGDDKLQRALRESPSRIANSLQDAMKAGIFILDRDMIDPNFDFVLPRAARTGRMAASTTEGIHIGKLRSTIGPTVNYAQHVYDYHRRRGNNFLKRFADNNEDEIQAVFTQRINDTLNNLYG